LRTPSSPLILDAAVLIAAALGRSSPVIWRVAELRTLATTERAVEEARRRIIFGLRRPDVLAAFEDVVGALSVIPMHSLEPLLKESAKYLRDAVGSRNGSTKDAHVLALAWGVLADIWSADRDFAGTGVASWSTPNLLRALGESND